MPAPSRARDAGSGVAVTEKLSNWSKDGSFRKPTVKVSDPVAVTVADEHRAGDPAQVLLGEDDVLRPVVREQRAELTPVVGAAPDRVLELLQV